MTLRYFKGRSVAVDDRVAVHRNLHSKDWSIIALDGPYKGLVVAHSDEVAIWGASFEVNEKGRQRVIRDRKKNVHARIVGKLGSYHLGPNGRLWPLRKKVKYNPYIDSSFMVFDQGESLVGRPVYRAGYVLLDDLGKAWAWAVRSA